MAEVKRSGLSLATRLFVATAGLVALAVGSAVALTLLIGNQIAERAVRQTLARANSVQSAFEQERLARLRLIAVRLAADPYFTAYVQDALANDDVPSLLDQLDERQEELGFDFAIVLDSEGLVGARTDEPGASGQDLSAEPLVARAFDEFVASGTWTDGDQMYSVVAVPLDSGGVLEGFLLVGFSIGDLRALELRRISDTEVSFIAHADGGSRLVASTLDGRMADELMSAVAARPDLLDVVETAEPRELELDHRTWLALVRPLKDAQGQSVGTVVSLASLAAQRQPYRRIGTVLAGVGLLAILAASMLSFVSVRRVLRPVRELASAAREAAEGNYDRKIQAADSDEVGQLAEAFGKLLSELREKRDMEVYINQLSRNLPEPETGPGETAELMPAEQREVVLLGVELRQYASRRLEGGEARQTLERLVQDVRPVVGAVSQHRGRLEAMLGHRLVASFGGEGRTQRAISAAAMIALGRRPSPSGDAPTLVDPGISQAASKQPPETAVLDTAQVLVSGQTVTGTVLWDDKPKYALTGGTMEHLEGLLRVARSGSILLASTTYAELEASFQAAGIEVQAHRSSVSDSPLYSLSAKVAERMILPDVSTTLAMTPAAPTGAPTLSGIGPGNLLGDRFEILSTLGSGGMGVVYKARDRTLDELVALKMLKQLAFDGSEQLERLKDELRLARKIGHANVLRTFDFGEVDGIPFITMEYVRGITLRQLLDRSGRLPLSAGLRLARQLCRGLAAAHAQSVLHRDIKPENLIIEHTGNAKLMDFGIARPIQRMKAGQTQPGAILGTPFYLAPEQLEGLEPDERADIYASGVVLYEIFTEQLPFEAQGNVMQIITQKLQKPPVPPRHYWPEMPEPLERLILRCLEIDREKRYRDVAGLLEDLEDLRA